MSWLQDMHEVPLVVGGPAAVLLLGPGEPAAVADLLSRAAASSEPERAVRAVLERVPTLPSNLAAAVRRPTYVRVFLRGAVEASALDRDGRRRPTSPGTGARWEERTFLGEASVRLTVLGGDGRPAVAAFLPPPARGATATLAKPEEPADITMAIDRLEELGLPGGTSELGHGWPAPASEAIGSPVELVVGPEPVAEVPVSRPAAVVGRPIGDETRIFDSAMPRLIPPSAAEEHADAGLPVAAGRPARATPPCPQPDPPRRASTLAQGDDSVLSDDELFEHLLHETRFHGVEAAAVRPDAKGSGESQPIRPPPVRTSGGEDAVETLGPEAAPLLGARGAPPPPAARRPPTSPPAHSAHAPSPPPPAAPEIAGLIDAVPAFGPSQASFVGSSPRLDPEDATGETRLVSSAVAPPTAATVTAGSSARPQVQAVLCPEQHPNPPQSTRCRRCSLAVSDRAVHLMPRPSLGRFRFDDGLVVELARPLLLGRNPSAAPSGPVAEAPQAIALADPERHLSRLHAEVVLEGWHVLIADCGSKNGTQVMAPNESPVRLRPGEPHLLLPGARVLLGPGSGFVFEGT